MEEITKGKAIFVDGASLFNMGRIHRIASQKAEEIFKILVKEVGSTEILVRDKETGKAMAEYVVKSGSATESLQKRIHSGGFEVIVVEESGNPSSDDKYINTQILALHPDSVSEIVLVSADLLDYVKSLRKKADQGIEIYVVGTRGIDPRSGNPMMSPESLEIAENEFHLIEIESYKDRIMRTPWVDNPRPRHPREDAFPGISLLTPGMENFKTSLTFSIKIADNERHDEILGSLMALFAKNMVDYHDSVQIDIHFQGQLE